MLYYRTQEYNLNLSSLFNYYYAARGPVSDRVQQKTLLVRGFVGSRARLLQETGQKLDKVCWQVHFGFCLDGGAHRGKELVNIFMMVPGL